ncbi:MAG: phenylalanine--tRNA ligase subunit beta [Sporomusaceae bacterium]|nr:phenylalanine--tRNA ligase subunit beta [Sporomusaceae bacterium]
MQASIKWLKEYVDFTVDPDVLGEQLTMAGIPVEAVQHLGENLTNVVTGKVLDIYPHPDADKLSICKIDVKTEILTIITGAKNVTKGAVVPVAKIGAKLPTGMKIKESKLRGLPSYGMLCSAKEMALDEKTLLPEEKDGIFLLSADTPIGEDIHTVLGLDDVILEFELTPNRADCFSMIGLAREIAVLTGGTLKKPLLNVKETGEGKASDKISISIADPSLCARFAARVLEDVKVGPSPEWLKMRLRSAGIRSINNIVDVTNFVMLEFGQPMHAYDHAMLSKQQITVRLANQGETITTLDDTKRELTDEMIVIADALQPVGVAGVMGGLLSEVTNQSRTIVLEAAAFHSARIRKTARKLGLRSEASGRFERGVNVSAVTAALDRAAQLLVDMGAAKVCTGIVDIYPNVTMPSKFSFTGKQINDYLGTDFLVGDMVDLLQKLDFAVVGPDSDGDITVTVPSWRSDVTGMADIAEEVARLKGYDQVPATTPQGTVVQGGQSYEALIADKVKNSLTANGFSEIITYSFIHPGAFDKIGLDVADPLRNTVPLLNPIVEEFSDLRTTLLPNLLETVARNVSRKNLDVKIFELGAIYLPQAEQDVLPEEPQRLAGALTGKRQLTAWNQGKEEVDFYDAKGVVETIFASLGIQDFSFEAAQTASFHPGKCAAVLYAGEIIGYVGEIHPTVQQAYGLNRKVYVFDLNFTALSQEDVMKALLGMGEVKKYSPLPKFPAISRDLALVLPESTEAKSVLDVIGKTKSPLLEEVSLFDVYTGEQVEKGAKSLAFSLVYRSNERTLTDAEVEPEYNKLVAALKETLQAKTRI